jgi:hypothetical protein
MFANEGKLVGLEGPLHVDVCQQDRLIINAVHIGLKLRRQRDEFCLLRLMK